VAIKVANTVVISDTRDITFITNQCTSRGLAGNVQISTTATLTGSGYSVCGNKVITTAGKAFSNAVFENSVCLLMLSPLTPQQGSISGYASGGIIPGVSNTIDKFPFTADANATDVGELNQGRYSLSGQSSSSSGYSSGGNNGVTSPAFENKIDKFPFSSDSSATDVGDLTQNRQGVAGQSSQVSGYTSGGATPPSNNLDTIDKFPFSSDANATDIGELSATKNGAAGQSSNENGYTSGGYNGIDKFPFASDTNASDVGDLVSPRFGLAGQSSETDGYTSGGGNPTVNTIDKFPFAVYITTTDVGDLTQARFSAAGQSSTLSGYTSGGTTSENTIDKFPFATDANATDVGDLITGRREVAGQQSGGNA